MNGFQGPRIGTGFEVECSVLSKLVQRYNEEFEYLVYLLRNGEFEEAKVRAVLLADLRRTISRLKSLKYCRSAQ